MWYPRCYGAVQSVGSRLFGRRAWDVLNHKLEPEAELKNIELLVVLLFLNT